MHTHSPHFTTQLQHFHIICIPEAQLHGTAVIDVFCALSRAVSEQQRVYSLFKSFIRQTPLFEFTSIHNTCAFFHRCTYSQQLYWLLFLYQSALWWFKILYWTPAAPCTLMTHCNDSWKLVHLWGLWQKSNASHLQHNFSYQVSAGCLILSVTRKRRKRKKAATICPGSRFHPLSTDPRMQSVTTGHDKVEKSVPSPSHPQELQHVVSHPIPSVSPCRDVPSF